MVIMGIDASMSSTGFCIFSGDDLLDYGFIPTSKKDYVDDMHRMNHICDVIQTVLDQYDIDVCVLEDTIPSNFRNVVAKLNMLKGMLLRTLEYNNIDAVLLHPTLVRRQLLGDGSASKEEACLYIMHNIIDIGPYNDTNGRYKTSDIYDSIALVVAYEDLYL